MKVEILNRGEHHELYSLMTEIAEANHPHLEPGLVLLGWRRGWKRDKSGRITLGQARRPTEMELAMGGKNYEFIVLLNADRWELLSIDQRRALIDHELCHCAISVDEAGDRKPRIQGHDLEEFDAVVRRNGMWKKDIEHFVNAATGKAEAEEEGEAGGDE